MSVKIGLVVPCYNEEEVLLDTAEKLSQLFDRLNQAGVISDSSIITFVDDGSKDKTWEIIEKLSSTKQYFTGVKLAHNAGHQYALLAGISAINEVVEATISIDADLQDDINVIESMVENFKNGDDVVYGVRSSRGNDSFFKKRTAHSYYKMMKKFGVDLIFDHADFRLLSRRVGTHLLTFKEAHLFLRGIIPMIGYKSSIVQYERKDRLYGTTKYPLKKMIQFAWNGITSFSSKPLRMILFSGLILSILSTLAFIPLLLLFLFNILLGIEWLIVIVAMGMFTGLLLFAMGILGEYIGKINIEVKDRPHFIIEKTQGLN